MEEDTGQGNRQVLGDIGNLEVFRIAEGKQISRPITRNFHAKQLTNGQAAENWVLNANEQEAAQGKKNVIAPSLDNKAIVRKKDGFDDLTHKPNPEPVDVVNFEAGDKVGFVYKRKYRKVQSLTSVLIRPSKAARGTLNEPEDHPVDINEDYANDDPAVAEYLDDLYKFYKLAEGDKQASDYMKSQHEINEKMRSITVDWLVDVHRRFKSMPETLFLTIYILDRYLSLTTIPKTSLQLVGICSMLLACKYEEIWPPQVNDFLSISDNAYTKNQILSMEKAILGKLQWNLTVPTPYVFLVRLIRTYIPPDQEVKNMAFFLAELGLVHYQAIVLHSPSELAAAAVYAARCTLNKRPFWNEILRQQAGYDTGQIIDCARLLVILHANAADNRLEAVYQKFLSPDKGAIALLSPPKDIVNRFLEA